MMIEEAYVSFEIAKLLKEKGFNVETEHKIWYVVKPYSTGTPFNSITYGVGEKTREYSKEHCISMPTQQMVMRWFLLNYDFFITVVCNNNQDLNFSFEIYEKVVEEHDSYWYKANVVADNNFNVPEEAIEAALKYCLEHYF